MAQFGMAAFHRVRLALVGQRLMLTRIVDQLGGDAEGIAVGRLSLWTLIAHRLKGGFRPFCQHAPVDHTARLTLDWRHDVDLAFFEPTQVNSASHSFTAGALGWGGVLGNGAARALTQCASVGCVTPSVRAMRRQFVPSAYSRHASWRVAAA